MAAEYLVATRSPDKFAEIQAISAQAARVTLLTLKDAGVAWSPAEDDVEKHATFLSNAIAKARYFAQLTGKRILADDSGIVVSALGGAPGVRTKRFAIDRGCVPAATSGKALDAANNALLLELLAGVAPAARTAYYVCAAACADDARVIGTAIAACRGIIAEAPAGAGGFGYDPLFLLPDAGVTFAQLTRAEKNQHSHRARAFRALLPQLKSL